MTNSKLLAHKPCYLTTAIKVVINNKKKNSLEKKVELLNSQLFIDEFKVKILKYLGLNNTQRIVYQNLSYAAKAVL